MDHFCWGVDDVSNVSPKNQHNNGTVPRTPRWPPFEAGEERGRSDFLLLRELLVLTH